MSLTKEQQEHVEKIFKQHVESEEKKKEREYKKYLTNLVKFIPIPIMVGGLAALLYYHYYGWEDLKKIILTWTIGVTLIATLSAAFINKIKNILS